MSEHTPPTLSSTTEATFFRRVLGAALPTLVLFVSPGCEASRVLREQLRVEADAHAGQLQATVVNAARETALAEQYGVQGTPTILVIRDGEVATRVVGYLPPGLLALLCTHVAYDALPRDPFWSPVEEIYEDLVLLPLLSRWGLTFVRQAPCRGRARVDVLAFEPGSEHPLTLFENKRRLYSAQALQQATAQAHGYARALKLRSFAVAAPAGLWLYACDAERSTLVRAVSGLQLHRTPEIVPPILRRLRDRL